MNMRLPAWRRRSATCCMTSSGMTSPPRANHLELEGVILPPARYLPIRTEVMELVLNWSRPVFRRFHPILFLALTSCATTSYGGELRPSLSRMTGTPDGPQSQVWVDSDRREVRVVAGPFRIPQMAMTEDGGSAHGGHGGHDSSMKTPLVPLVWPVDAGITGFKLGVFSGDGTPLPRDLIHHLNTLNFDRRELLYPVPTRLIAIGSDTPDTKVPNSYQVVVERGDNLGWYIMWNNDTGQAIEDVYVELVLPYGELDKEVDPITSLYLDTNLYIGNETSFDLPPGRFEKSYEFEVPTGGKLLAAGGHVHDYGLEVRVEDVETGKVLFRLESQRDEEGRVSGVEMKIFRRFFNLFDASIELKPNHPYRIVGVYHNPTGETLPGAGMAQIGGLFKPHDPAAWPENDPSDPLYQLDLSGLPEPLANHGH